MRPGALVLLFLVAAGCRPAPHGPFDSGHTVHVILRGEDLPPKGVRIEPVCTIGPETVRSEERLLGGVSPDALEVAVLRAPAGKHRISIWEPRTGQGARGDLDLEGERWVVMEFAPGGSARLRSYDRPPHEQAGSWRPLVRLPD